MDVGEDLPSSQSLAPFYRKHNVSHPDSDIQKKSEKINFDDVTTAAREKKGVFSHQFYLLLLVGISENCNCLLFSLLQHFDTL